MKILLLLLAALVLVFAVAWLIGALLPREHTATRSLVLAQPAAPVFATLRDSARHPEWRRDVKSLELLPADGALTRYRETTSHGAITYVVRESSAPHRLVTEIADDSLPFGGRWTIELTPAGDGRTRVRITEDGFVRSALFRFFARFVFGHTRTMETYLRHLAAKFHEPAILEP